MTPEELIKWFKEEILPIVSKRVQWSDTEEVESIQECEFDDMEKGVSNFASTPSIAKLVLKTRKGVLVRRIFVKFQCQNPIFIEKMKLTLQFKNEVTMYDKILPTFEKFLKDCGKSRQLIDEIVPKCRLASYNEANPEKSIVVLEDLGGEGYRLSELVTELDLQHCLPAFEKLANFHAISFAMKFRNEQLLNTLKNSFAKVWTEDEPWTRSQCEHFRGFCCQRGIEYLMSQKEPEVPREYLNNLKKMIHPSGLFDLLVSVSSPKEPLSVICHGDFNRNNILYRYNNGEVIDAKLIDFQTFVYGPPSLDLSFFIYMNTTLEFREKHFDYILQYYHSCLVKRISFILEESEEAIARKLPLTAFRDDFSKVAITAYVIVSFFLPAMMVPPIGDFEKDLIEKDFKELAEMNYNQGGDVVSRRIADVLVDFYRRGFYVS